LGLTGSGGQLLCNPPTLFIPIFKQSVRVKVKSCLEFGTPCFTTVHNLFLTFMKWGVCGFAAMCTGWKL
jgi:hypothetical protein